MQRETLSFYVVSWLKVGCWLPVFVAVVVLDSEGITCCNGTVSFWGFPAPAGCMFGIRGYF